MNNEQHCTARVAFRGMMTDPATATTAAFATALLFRFRVKAEET